MQVLSDPLSFAEMVQQANIKGLPNVLILETS